MGKRRPRRDKPTPSRPGRGARRARTEHAKTEHAKTERGEVEPAEPKVVRASGPEDLLAIIPYRLGFHPTHSLVVVALEGRRQRLGLTLRVDLPELAQVPDLARYVVRTLTHHDVGEVLLLTYAADDEVAEPLVRTLLQWLERADIAVQDAYRSDDARWFCYTCDDVCCPADGTPYDLTANPLAAEAVLHGHVALPDREDVRQWVAPVSGPARSRMRECIASAEAELGDRLIPALAEDALAEEADAEVAAAALAFSEGADDIADEVRSFVTAWLARPRPLTDTDVAALATQVGLLPARDAAWLLMGREDATLHRDLWLEVLRRVVPPYEPPVACLAGFAAWLSGESALSWCAVERALDADPGYRMAELITEMLTRAVPPSAWEEVRRMDSERWAS